MKLQNNKIWVYVSICASLLKVTYTFLGTILSIGCINSLLNYFSWIVIPFAAGFTSVYWSKPRIQDMEKAIRQSANVGLVIGIFVELLSFSVNLLFRLFKHILTGIYVSRNLYHIQNNFSNNIFALACFLFHFITDITLSIIGGIIAVSFRKK